MCVIFVFVHIVFLFRRCRRHLFPFSHDEIPPCFGDSWFLVHSRVSQTVLLVNKRKGLGQHFLPTEASKQRCRCSILISTSLIPMIGQLPPASLKSEAPIHRVNFNACDTLLLRDETSCYLLAAYTLWCIHDSNKFLSRVVPVSSYL